MISSRRPDVAGILMQDIHHTITDVARAHSINSTSKTTQIKLSGLVSLSQKTTVIDSFRSLLPLNDLFCIESTLNL